MLPSNWQKYQVGKATLVRYERAAVGVINLTGA